jgi:hypothetical protein
VQSHYVKRVLSRFGYVDCNTSPTPYDPSVKFPKNQKKTRDQLIYSQINGSLVHLVCATRPHISFQVSKLSQLVASPGDNHWHGHEMVMRYLKGTISYGIHCTGYREYLKGIMTQN